MRIEHDGPRGYYVIGNGLNSTAAEFTEAAAVAARDVRGEYLGPTKVLGDAKATILPKSPIKAPSRSRLEPKSIGLRPTRTCRGIATGVTATCMLTRRLRRHDHAWIRAERPGTGHSWTGRISS
jgi:hypothetical protein